MPLGALSICQVSNQLSGKLVDVHAPEVIDLLSLEIEDGRLCVPKTLFELMT
jgi:hypothetical protein